MKLCLVWLQGHCFSEQFDVLVVGERLDFWSHLSGTDQLYVPVLIDVAAG